MALTPTGLFYEVLDGPPGAAAVLLSPGLGGGATFWGPQLPALTGRYRVLLYDHRGTGRSTRTHPANVTVSDLAADMVEVLDAAGVGKAHLIGHAAGGNAGLQLALDHPERLDRLVVVNGWAGPDPHIRRCFDTRLTLLRASGPLAYIHAQPLFLFPAAWISEHAALLDEQEPHHLAEFQGAATLEARIAALLAFDIRDRLGEIGHPVLLSASADDMLVPVTCSEQLAAGLPNGRLDVVPWGGHAFTVTDPDKFNASVLDFLGRD